MPNPDGTRTRNEHRREILARAQTYVSLGWLAEDAIDQAGEDHREAIKREGDRKVEQVMRFLARR